jgi:transcriptional regulator with XRE-family HTH domain
VRERTVAAPARSYAATVAAGPNSLGARLRALRTGRGHSLAEVAEATGLSASFLSLVENGRSDITISRLVRVVDFYRVRITDLLDAAPSADSMVVRRNEHRHLYSRA